MDRNQNPGSTELQYLLEKLIALHRNLLDVLREEHGHMVAIDVKGLGETAHAKEVMLGEIWNHEQLRIKAAERLSVALALDPRSATLLSISAALPAPDGEKLRSARTALNLLVSQAKELNARNMAFAENSLQRIDEMKKNVLGLANNTNKENYSNSGVRQPTPEQGGRLLSTEA